MSSYSNKTGKSKYVAALVLLLLIGGAVAALELTDTTHFFHKKEPAGTATSYTKGNTASDDGSGSDGSSQSDSSTDAPAKNQKDTSTDATTSGVTLAKPSGNFVSNHHPVLSNAARSLESSVCNTTPGAKCVIVFVKDGQTKSLAKRVTDSGGSAYWDWHLKDIGLTAGSWRIKAVVTLGSQTETAYDPQNLEVSR
jgi:hypothetical protein